MLKALWDFRAWLRFAGAAALLLIPAAAGLLPSVDLATPHLQLLLLAAVLVSASLYGLGMSFVAATLGFGLLLWRAVDQTPADGGGQGWTLEAGAALNAFLWFILAKLAAALVATFGRRIAQLSAERSRAEAEARQRELLLAELSHRVMNDMQKLASVLHAEARQAAEPETAGALRAAARRVRVLGRVHERLSAQRRGGPATADATVADSRFFIEGLVADLRAGVEGVRPVSLTVAAEAHLLPLAAMADVGLVVNELVTNALKHAFPGEREGVVRVTFRCEGGICELAVADNGVGLAAAAGRETTARLQRAASTDKRGQGDRLLRALAAQLGGRLEVVAGEVGGTLCRLRFPKPASATSGTASEGTGWSDEPGPDVTDPADLAPVGEQRRRAAQGPSG